MNARPELVWVLLGVLLSLAVLANYLWRSFVRSLDVKGDKVLTWLGERWGHEKSAHHNAADVSRRRLAQVERDGAAVSKRNDGFYSEKSALGKRLNAERRKHQEEIKHRNELMAERPAYIESAVSRLAFLHASVAAILIVLAILGWQWWSGREIDLWRTGWAVAVSIVALHRLSRMAVAFFLKALAHSEGEQIRVSNDSSNPTNSQPLIGERDAAGPEKRKSKSSEQQKIGPPMMKRRSLVEAMAELNSLVGLTMAKDRVQRLVALQQANAARKKAGIETPALSHHMAFVGNPGTGKTTVARIVGDIYRELGVLSSGHIVETDRSGLVASYLGQTAAKVVAQVDLAMDGILFIDEAYSLVAGENPDSFGMEAVDTLVKLMEDRRERLVVVFAGYGDQVDELLGINPGLRSRVRTSITFEDFTVDELLSIYVGYCKKQGWSLPSESERLLKHSFRKARGADHFGNARFVRNLFDRTLENHAVRVAADGNVTRDELRVLSHDDVSEAVSGLNTGDSNDAE